MFITLFNQDIEIWKLLMSFGILLIGAEIFIPGFIALPIGLALIITAAFTPLFSSVSPVLMLLAVNLLIMLFIFQWILKKKFSTDELASNADALIGKEAIAVTKISHIPGQAKVFAEIWTAITENNDLIAEGEKVVICRIDGNKLVVTKLIV